MIDPNELRPGNKLYYQGNDESADQIVTVEGYVNPHVYHTLPCGCCSSFNKVEDFDPIPLTPEWLEQCGFKDQGMYWERKEAPAFVLLKDDKGLYIGNPVRTHVHTVHHLQNLVFALTEGEELQINLP
jgi:hypothetical protein